MNRENPLSSLETSDKEKDVFERVKMIKSKMAEYLVAVDPSLDQEVLEKYLDQEPQGIKKEDTEVLFRSGTVQRLFNGAAPIHDWVIEDEACEKSACAENIRELIVEDVRLQDDMDKLALDGGKAFDIFADLDRFIARASLVREISLGDVDGVIDQRRQGLAINIVKMYLGEEATVPSKLRFIVGTQGMQRAQEEFEQGDLDFDEEVLPEDFEGESSEQADLDEDRDNSIDPLFEKRFLEVAKKKEEQQVDDYLKSIEKESDAAIELFLSLVKDRMDPRDLFNDMFNIDGEFMHELIRSKRSDREG